MRRKSDMWRDVGDDSSFLPGEREQQERTAAADVMSRLGVVEEQLRGQFTSMAAYAQIAQQSVDTARAEGRADLDREISKVVTLVERARDEFGTPRIESLNTSSATPAPAPASIDITALARIALLEDKFEVMSQQFIECLRSQQELANSIAYMFEQQMRNRGFAPSFEEPVAH